MKKTLYIAYGSNMNLKQMAYRCPTARVVGKAELRGYELVFRGAYGGAVATIEKKKDSSVPVLIWEIEPLDEKALDRYEGYPRLYRKEWVKVKVNSKAAAAMVYIMNEGRPKGLPSEYYYNVILEGYITAGIDTMVLERAAEKSGKDGGQLE